MGRRRRRHTFCEACNLETDHTEVCDDCEAILCMDCFDAHECGEDDGLEDGADLDLPDDEL